MTDNRTSEPTEAMILAGLNRVDWDAIRAGEADPREAAAHAIWHALEAAAQGAAPQAETDRALEIAHELAKVHTFTLADGEAIARAALSLATPVLPSSGVDEDD